MLAKLQANEHKGHWLTEDQSIYWFYGRLNEEYKELQHAFADWVMKPNASTWHAVELEMADVANFMMMLIDIARTNHYPVFRRAN